ncbi:Uncharacterised protein [Mycobacterium tuberculosis]|nr:Uncharacterised protein [Mycobacterium tuberculosis]CNZ14811.1 Uncharacterised protein [Mycobacterium tuberculosis]
MWSRDEQRHRNHERNGGNYGGDTDHPRPARSGQFVVQVGRLLIVVVVIEPEIGWHIRAASDVLGFRSRVCPRICVGLARLVTGQFVAAPGDGRQVVAGSPFVARVADGFRFGFVRFPSRGIRPAHVCLPCPTASPTRVAFRLHPCPRARRILHWCHGNPTQPGRTEKSGQPCYWSTDALIVTFPAPDQCFSGPT